MYSAASLKSQIFMYIFFGVSVDCTGLIVSQINNYPDISQLISFRPHN